MIGAENMRLVGRLFVRTGLAFLLGFGSKAFAQALVPPPVGGTIQLSTPGEVPLSDFIDLMSQRLGVRFLYDDSVRQKRVNLIAPDPIPVKSMAEILQSVLINEGLVVTDIDQQGFKRITTNAQIPLVSRPSATNEDLAKVDSATPLTRVFLTQQGQPTKLAELLRPFLSQQGASVIPLDRSNLLMVTDVARNVRRAEQLIKILDGRQNQVDIEFVPAKNVAVTDLAIQLGEILTSRRKAMGMAEDPSGALEVSVDQRTNSLILIGTPTEIDRATKLLDQLDRPLDTQQRVFSLRFYAAEQFDKVIRGIVAGRPIKPPYQSRVEGNALIVDSTPEVLQLVERTQNELDTREAPAGQSPVRFYKIKNVPAQELVETIRGIGGQITSAPRRQILPPRQRTTNDIALPGANLSPLDYPGDAQPVQIPLTPPAFRQVEDPANPLGRPIAERLDSMGRVFADGFEQGFPANLTITEEFPASAATGLVGAAEVTVDVHTNTIIVVASPEVQRIYATLIETLDERRPQVLIEAQVVIIDTSDDYQLGVEISGGDRTGAKRLFSFSSFGLSTVDPASGALSIIPGVGFNGTLVDPETADVVVRALTNHRRARVLSVPRILVNDNSEGQLTSVLEVPFTSVNASQTVATTSFAGFAEAGTTITATPTISDDNYLHLDYTVTLNSFTGVGSDGVPPPRQTNEVRSRVTIPDGYTVIVGGLTSKNESSEIDSIPWLELIPVVRKLASLETKGWRQTSLFVFLKPVILREDKFKDLRFISDTNLRDATLHGNFPSNAPLTIE